MSVESGQFSTDLAERLSKLQLRLFDKKLDLHKKSRSRERKSVEMVESKEKIGPSYKTRHKEFEVLKEEISKMRYEQDLMHRQLDEQHRSRTKRKSPSHKLNSLASFEKYNKPAVLLPTNNTSKQMLVMMQMMMLQQQQQMQNLMTARLLFNNSGSTSSPASPYIVILPQPQPQPPPSITPPWYMPPHMANGNQRRTRQDSEDSVESEELVENVSLTSERKAFESQQTQRKSKFPFPGNSSQQQLRRLGYAAFFCASLHRLADENKFRPSQDFIFELRLKEIEKALHKIYQQPQGRIYGLLSETILGSNCTDFQTLINSTIEANNRKYSQQLSDILLSLSHLITEIMPKDGILGATRNSCVYEMLIVGQKFPPKYFFDIEKELITVNPDETTLNLHDEGAIMLLFGVFVIRSMVLTLFMRPKLYGLIAQPSSLAQGNLKVLSTLFFYIYRDIITLLKSKLQKSKSSTSLLPLPNEVAQFLFSDEQLQPLLKLCKKSIENCKNTFLEWCHEYVSRIRESAFS